MNRFDNKLEKLHIKIVSLGSLIEAALSNAVEALIEGDKVLAQTVIDNDKEINTLAYSIERSALKILLKEHPVASDLRAISTALKIIDDMERIGDQASDISEIALHIANLEEKKKAVSEIKDICTMAEISKTMVKKSVASFIEEDTELADKVITMDTEVDKLFHKFKRDMIEFIKSESEYADQVIYLLMVAKYFEKIGDYSESIADWVKFLATGEYKSTKLI